MFNSQCSMKKVTVLVGAGSIGQAIIRRVSAGKHVVLADYSLEHAEQAAKTLERGVTNVVNAAGVSPSQAPVAEILRVDLYGTSV